MEHPVAWQYIRFPREFLFHIQICSWGGRQRELFEQEGALLLGRTIIGAQLEAENAGLRN